MNLLTALAVVVCLALPTHAYIIDEFQTDSHGYKDLPSTVTELQTRLDRIESIRQSQHQIIQDFLDRIFAAISEARETEAAPYFSSAITTRKGWHEAIIDRDNFQGIEIFSLRPDAQNKLIEVRAMTRTAGLTEGEKHLYTYIKLRPTRKSFVIAHIIHVPAEQIGLELFQLSMKATRPAHWPAYTARRKMKQSAPALGGLGNIRELATEFVSRFYSHLTGRDFSVTECLLDDALFVGNSATDWNAFLARHLRRELGPDYIFPVTPSEVHIIGIRPLLNNLVSVDVYFSVVSTTPECKHLTLRQDAGTGFKIIAVHDGLPLLPLVATPIDSLVTGDELLSTAQKDLSKFLDETLRLIDSRKYFETEDRVSPTLLNQYVWNSPNNRAPWQVREKFVQFCSRDFRPRNYANIKIGTIRLDPQGHRADVRARIEYSDGTYDWAFIRCEYIRDRGFRLFEYKNECYDPTQGRLPGPVEDYPVK